MTNLDRFTPAQREAITTDEKRVVVAAGPGSGKTTVLVERIRRLIEGGVDPSKIVCLTFTNAAAREIEERLIPKDGDKVSTNSALMLKRYGLGHVGTLHSFALRILREHGEGIGYGERLSIVSPESALVLLESKARSLGCKEPIDKLLKLKAEGRPHTHDTRIAPGGPIAAQRRSLSVPETVVLAYYDELRDAGIVDFDLILSECLRLIEAEVWIAGHYDHLLVDEVQDSAEVDWAIYRGLPIPNKWLCGDHDQSVYSFRGGAPEEMLAESRWNGSHLILLEENFRSHWEICEAANRLIRHNKDRIDKTTKSIKGSGGVVSVVPPLANEGAEIGWVAHQIALAVNTPFNDIKEQPLIPIGINPSEIAVIARTNRIAEGFQRTFEATGLPVRKREQSDLPRDWPFARALVELLVQPENDTLAFFYLVAKARNAGASEKDALELAHDVQKKTRLAGETINRRVLGFGPNYDAERFEARTPILSKEGVSLQSRMLIADLLKTLPVVATVADLALAMASQGAKTTKEEGDGIEVLTAHAAKGREWDVVFVVGAEDEGWPGRRKDEDIEESRRLFYVALTRARREVFITCAQSRVAKFGQFEKIEARTPSRFLKELSL